MSFPQRMGRIVGDQNTVSRYLTEKIGHTALIAWTFVMLFGVRPLPAAIAAALTYIVVGKALWWIGHRTFNAKDFVFDFVVGLMVAVIAVRPIEGWLITVGFFAAWCAAIAAGSNNQWGSPS